MSLMERMPGTLHSDLARNNAFSVLRPGCSSGATAHRSRAWRRMSNLGHRKMWGWVSGSCVDSLQTWDQLLLHSKESTLIQYMIRSLYCLLY